MPSIRPTAALAALFVTTPGLLVDPQPPADAFQRHVAEASAAREKGDLLGAQDHVAEALLALRAEFRAAAMKCMPRRPAGFERIDEEARPAPGGSAAANPLVVAGSRPAEQLYRAFEGSGWIRATLQPNAPGVRQILTDLERAESIENCEIVEYETRIALLRHSPFGLRLSFVLHDRHLLDVRGQGVDLDTLRKTFTDAVLRDFDALLKPR